MDAGFQKILNISTLQARPLLGLNCMLPVETIAGIVRSEVNMFKIITHILVAVAEVGPGCEVGVRVVGDAGHIPEVRADKPPMVLRKI